MTDYYIEKFYSMFSTRRMQWKSFVIVVLVSLGGGCHRFLPPPEPAQFQGTTVKVSAPPGAADMIRAQSMAWSGRQDARVEVVELPAEKPAEDSDIWVLPPAELP